MGGLTLEEVAAQKLESPSRRERRDLEQLRGCLGPDEAVLTMAVSYSGGPGVLALTTERFLFAMSKKGGVFELPYEAITACKVNEGRFGAVDLYLETPGAANGDDLGLTGVRPAARAYEVNELITSADARERARLLADEADMAGQQARARQQAEEQEIAARVGPIQELARNKLTAGFTWTVKREMQKLPGLLHENEQVLNLAQGYYDDHEGLVAVTDHRVMFVEEGLMFRSRLEDFPYDRISSVQTERTMLVGKLIIFASGNKAEIKNITPKERALEIGDYVRGRLSGHKAAPVSVHVYPSGCSEGTRPVRPTPQARRVARRGGAHSRGVRATAGQVARPPGRSLARGLNYGAARRTRTTQSARQLAGR